MLLFDQNLSYKLCNALAEDFLGCRHVREAGLSDADDADVWNYAGANGLTIVSKDQDFRRRAMLLGAPPKCTTADIANLLRKRESLIQEFQRGEGRLLILAGR